MRKNMFGKGLVVVIIVLFLGASVVPSISGNVESNIEPSSQVSKSSSTTDWWSMFRHDPPHS